MKIKLLSLLVMFALMSACSSLKPTALENNNDECIPPLYDIAFPIVTPQSPNAATPRQISPRGNWQIQDDLPFPQNEFGSLYMRSKQNELVFTGQFDKIFIYSINNKQWKSYQLADRVSDSIFVASDGVIWGAGLLYTDQTRSREARPYLLRFNDANGNFEFVEDVSGFLQSPQVRIVSNIAEDESGLLWFFAQTDKKQILTSFNVKTHQSKQYYVGGLEAHDTLAIGTDGSLWFLKKTKNQLIHYNPSSQESHVHEFPNPADTGKLPFNFDKASYISMDRSGRLWLANYGWLEFSNNDSPVWNRVIESPVFVTDSGLPGSQYTMSYQTSVYQSSNGWYWFTGGSGIVRLDLEQGAWCLITTESSDVVEDNGQNLWIAASGHLYKYPLKQ